MSEMYHVSSSPHVRAKDSTAKIMLWVIVAMIPMSLFGIYNFGLRALLLLAITVLSCVASEWIYNKITKRKQTVGDLSAVVTGMILALNMPVTLPLWEAVLGAIFAIVIVKMLFGGLGQNFMNPALAGRCFLVISFAADMTNFTCDAYSGPTPLAMIRNNGGIIPSDLNLMDMLIGKTGGTIGETSVICILIGAIILILAGVINLRIPAAYIISFAVLMFVFGPSNYDITYVVAQLCGGGLMFGAFFMATDYVTTPITPVGQIIFGICCGVFTAIFRLIGANAEGVSFAIILSNLLVPLIEKVTVPNAFGVKKVKVKKEGN